MQKGIWWGGKSGAFEVEGAQSSRAPLVLRNGMQTLLSSDGSIQSEISTVPVVRGVLRPCSGVAATVCTIDHLVTGLSNRVDDCPRMDGDWHSSAALRNHPACQHRLTNSSHKRIQLRSCRRIDVEGNGNLSSVQKHAVGQISILILGSSR